MPSRHSGAAYHLMGLYESVITDGKLIGEKPEFSDARSLLRSGPAGSLRTDIRAVCPSLHLYSLYNV